MMTRKRSFEQKTLNMVTSTEHGEMAGLYAGPGRATNDVGFRHLVATRQFLRYDNRCRSPLRSNSRDYSMSQTTSQAAAQSSPAGSLPVWIASGVIGLAL